VNEKIFLWKDRGNRTPGAEKKAGSKFSFMTTELDGWWERMGEEKGKASNAARHPLEHLGRHAVGEGNSCKSFSGGGDRRAPSVLGKTVAAAIMREEHSRSREKDTWSDRGEMTVSTENISPG